MRVPGGYRLTGQWGFCSGSDFSEWLIFNAPAGEAGEGHMFLVPRRTRSRSTTGSRPGMRGTGSRTMAVDDVFVPDHRVQATRDTVQKLQERRALHPTFDTMYAHWPSYGRFTFAATAVGAAWGAAEHFAATRRRRPPASPTPWAARSGWPTRTTWRPSSRRRRARSRWRWR